MKAKTLFLFALILFVILVGCAAKPAPSRSFEVCVIRTDHPEAVAVVYSSWQDGAIVAGARPGERWELVDGWFLVNGMARVMRGQVVGWVAAREYCASYGAK
jgi:hypothetical protein